MGRPNPKIWVWANRRLGIFGGHPLTAENQSYSMCASKSVTYCKMHPVRKNTFGVINVRLYE